MGERKKKKKKKVAEIIPHIIGGNYSPSPASGSRGSGNNELEEGGESTKGKGGACREVGKGT
jgi:hypothetical protein